MKFYVVKNPSQADIDSSIKEVDEKYFDENGQEQTRKVPIISGEYVAGNGDKYLILARETAYSNGIEVSEDNAWLFCGNSHISTGSLNAGTGITDLDVRAYTSGYARGFKQRFNIRNSAMSDADKISLVLLLPNAYMLMETGELGAARKLINEQAISGVFTQAVKDDMLNDCDKVCDIFPWLKEL